MKRISIFAAMLAVILPVLAQRPANALTEEDYYYLNFADVLESFDEETDGVNKAFYYAIADLDNDGSKELVMADVYKTKCVFKVVDGEVHLISPDYTVNDDELNYIPIYDFYTMGEADRSNDITIKHHPVFAYDIKIERNRFTVPGDVAWDEKTMRSTKYNRMVFKPHVGNIHFVKAEPGSYNSDGNPIDLGMCYTYALDDAAFTKKMFRGYNNDAATPIIVPEAWLKDHTPLQYKRWLTGEPVPKVDATVKRIIENYYGDQDQIRDISWIASCDINERTFYEVLFQPRNGKVLLAFVCLAEGDVVSTRNMWFDQSKSDPNSIDFGAEIDDVLGFTPEIQVMAATPAGLELYVRWYSFEGSHFDIWREVADQFVTIVGDYHYIMAY